MSTKDIKETTPKGKFEYGNMSVRELKVSHKGNCYIQNMQPDLNLKGTLAQS